MVSVEQEQDDTDEIFFDAVESEELIPESKLFYQKKSQTKLQKTKNKAN